MAKAMLVSAKWLIDAKSGAPISEGALLVEAGKIKAVGKKVDFGTLAETVEVRDYPDSTLMPGLVDAHTHLSLDTELDQYLTRMNDKESELTIRACYTMIKDLRSGVTTNRCMGDRFFLDVAVKKAVEAGKLEGPNLVVATRGIRASHAHGFVGLPFDGPEAIRLAVRENIKAGADFIKFYMTGTVQKGERIPFYLSEEEVRTILYEAHSTGLTTAVHCIGGPGLVLCVEAGVDTIEHGYYISDSEIELMKKKNTWLVLTPGEFLEDKPTMSAAHNGAFAKDRQIIRARMKAVVKSGLAYAVGTDADHGQMANQLIYLQEAGATPMEALVAGTLNGARVCGLEQRTGSLEPGKEADLLVVKGNPLDDLNQLKAVQAVYLRGRSIRLE